MSAFLSQQQLPEVELDGNATIYEPTVVVSTTPPCHSQSRPMNVEHIPAVSIFELPPSSVFRIHVSVTPEVETMNVAVSSQGDTSVH